MFRFDFEISFLVSYTAPISFTVLEGECKLLQSLSMESILLLQPLSVDTSTELRFETSTLVVRFLTGVL